MAPMTRGLGWVAALGAVVACEAASTSASPCPPSPFRSSPPVVIAHAGGEGLGPGNTLEAMTRSLAAGADILDVDLRMTSDGVIVARHDRDVATTTDGAGYVDELTWRDVSALDAAAQWTGDPVERPVRVPSLRQVLDSFPDVRISLELKQTVPSMAEELCRQLRVTESTTRVYLSANDDDAVYAARDACPEVLITTTYRDLDEMRAAEDAGRPWCAASPIGQPPFRPGRFDNERVERSHAQGRAIYTWTVDDPDDLRDLAVAGVDGVYTRRPDIARQVFDELDVDIERNEKLGS
jgi:glycerophosphoryl diester phosphodiesterase